MRALRNWVNKDLPAMPPSLMRRTGVKSNWYDYCCLLAESPGQRAWGKRNASPGMKCRRSYPAPLRLAASNIVPNRDPMCCHVGCQCASCGGSRPQPVIPFCGRRDVTDCRAMTVAAAPSVRRKIILDRYCLDDMEQKKLQSYRI